MSEIRDALIGGDANAEQVKGGNMKKIKKAE